MVPLQAAIHDLMEIYMDQEAEIGRLRAVLMKYGTHMHDCRMQDFRDETDCTCGWRDVEVNEQITDPLEGMTYVGEGEEIVTPATNEDGVVVRVPPQNEQTASDDKDYCPLCLRWKHDGPCKPIVFTPGR